MERHLNEFVVSLIRIAAYIKRRDLRESLERLSIELVECVNKSEFIEATRILKTIEEIIKIGGMIAEIEPVNASIISEKIGFINKQITSIAGLQEFGNWSDIRIADSAEEEIGAEKEENGNSAMRQSAIVDKIRQYQSGTERATLKEIMAALPSVSERTVRYDLQKLCAKGVIERVGQGGPSTHYVIK